jgi:DNA-binding NarL/FixJ family response regulator
VSVLRVVLADDQAMVRSGLRALLAAEPDLEVVAEASDGGRPWTQSAANTPM